MHREYKGSESLTKCGMTFEAQIYLVCQFHDSSSKWLDVAGTKINGTSDSLPPRVEAEILRQADARLRDEQYTEGY